MQELEVANKKLQEQHNAEMEAMQLRHGREKRKLVQRNILWRNDLRVLKISNARLKKGLDIKVKTEENLHKELQAMEATNKKLHEQRNSEMEAMLRGHAREKRNLVQRNIVWRIDLRVLKISNARLKKGLDIKVKTEENLHKELQAMEATNKKLHEQRNSEMEAMKLRHAIFISYACLSFMASISARFSSVA